MKLEKILKKYENYIKNYKTKEIKVEEIPTFELIKRIEEKRKKRIFIPIKDIKTLFNDFSRTYIFVRINPAEYLAFLKLLIEQIKFKRNDKVLSLGSGCGILETFLAKEFNCKVIGIDIAKKQIEIAKSIAQKERLRNVDFVCDDIRQLKFKDNFFDKVISQATLHWTQSDLFRVIKEVKRVLKENGTFLFNCHLNFTPLLPKEKEIVDFLRREKFSVKSKKNSFENHPVVKEKVTWLFVIAKI